ncbi:MBL fold metallo-hydrolase [soil metagenome]
MKFTIVSHACLSVEHGGTSLLVDPWIVGSCYWRSWWNFPEPPQALVASLKPDYIYLTHLHWDHFHGPSLRRFDRATKLLIPKTISARFREDLEWLGFHDITEIPHAGTYELAPGFALSSYQFGHPTDSAIVVTDGVTTLFDVNDAKFFGASLAQILTKYPSIDFVFKSHSSASPIPYCIEDYDGRFSEVLSRQDYIEEFAEFALHVAARHAIPFASNHCFLHRETVKFNATAVNPEDVRRYFEHRAAEVGARSRCVVMTPGSSWDDRTGFAIEPFDYSRRDAYIAEMQTKHAGALEAQYALEASTSARFEAFETYFTSFFAALPRVLAKRVGRRIIFHAGSQSFGLDFLNRKVIRDVAPEPTDMVFEVPALVLNDLCEKKMFSAWTPSKRLSIQLPGTSLAPLFTFLTLIDYYETGYLPLRGLVSRRFAEFAFRRAREVAAISEAVARLVNARITKTPLRPRAFFEPERRYKL